MSEAQSETQSWHPALVLRGDKPEPARAYTFVQPMDEAARTPPYLGVSIGDTTVAVPLDGELLQAIVKAAGLGLTVPSDEAKAAADAGHIRIVFRAAACDGLPIIFKAAQPAPPPPVSLSFDPLKISLELTGVLPAPIVNVAAAAAPIIHVEAPGQRPTITETQVTHGTDGRIRSTRAVTKPAGGK